MGFTADFQAIDFGLFHWRNCRRFAICRSVFVQIWQKYMASSGIGFLIYAPLALFLCDKTFIQLIALWFGSKVGHSPHMAFAGCRLLGVRMFPGKPGLNIPGRVAILGIMPQMPASALFPACRQEASRVAWAHFMPAVYLGPVGQSGKRRSMTGARLV